MRMLALLLTLFILVFLNGCVSPAQQQQTQNATPQNTASSCESKDCLIATANGCQEMNLTVAEDFGTMEYLSSTDCVFTKTLVSLNENETQEMKNLLEGKSMSCAYEKGKFDSRLAISLIYGMENCQGDLKDSLGKLIIFS